MVKKIFVLIITVLFSLSCMSGCTFLGTNYKFGYIDKEGNFVIEPQYGSALNFSEDLQEYCTALQIMANGDLLI